MTRLPRAALVGVLALAPVLAPALPTPAYAADATIEISADGPSPVTTRGVDPGDSVTFVNVDTSFPHTVRSTSTNWGFRVTLQPGQSYTVPAALSREGVYTFGDDSPLEDYAGQVVVGDPSPSPTPTRSPSARPTANPPASQPPAASPAPSGSPEATPSGTPSATPSGAPTSTAGPSGSPSRRPSGTPVAAASPDAAGPDVLLGSGPLPEPPSPRRFGLPVALALTLAFGAGSLLVRYLLMHPAGRRTS